MVTKRAKQVGLTTAERAAAKFMAWAGGVQRRGEWGVTPKEAASMLQCSPGLIGKLVDEGVLVRNEYSDDFGHSVVMISLSSIETAQATKAESGTFSGKPSHRPTSKKENK